MKKTIPDSYTLINCIFAGIIFLVFLYSFVYGFEGTTHPIPSGSHLIGDAAMSTGLSRSFSAMTHLDLNRAMEMNPYGPRIFFFFVIQWCMRLSGIIIYKYHEPIPHKIVPVTDAILSAILFIAFFWPFIQNRICGVLC